MCPIATIALLLAGAAAAQTPTPVWRRDPTHLATDRGLIAACLASGAGGAMPAACASAVGEGYYAAAGEGAAVTTVQRQCIWRAITAWEDELNQPIVIEGNGPHTA